MILRVLLLIVLVVVIVLLIIKYSKHSKESFSNYLNCIKKGFTKNFCIRNKLNPSSCLCENGNVGKIVPGYKGECVCGRQQRKYQGSLRGFGALGSGGS